MRKVFCSNHYCSWHEQYYITLFLCIAFAFAHLTVVTASELPAHDDLDHGINVAVDDIQEYRLSTGDKIKVHVFGERDMDVEVRLGSSGNIRYPFLGNIHVVGMTLAQLEQKITRGLLGDYLINPQVRVSMEEFRPFYINGEVKKPGSYPYQPSLTVRKAISLAGGFTENADKSKLFIIPADNLQKEESPVVFENKIGPGDILTIKRSFFFVTGEVKRPGKYPYHVGLTIRTAISLAGGLTDNADKNKLFIIPSEAKEKEETHVLMEQKMQSDDILTVKQSFFFVAGEVAKPGKYPYREELTYRMAISLAGGIKEKGDEDKVFVLHEKSGKDAEHLKSLDTKIMSGDMITIEQSFF